MERIEQEPSLIVFPFSWPLQQELPRTAMMRNNHEPILPIEQSNCEFRRPKSMPCEPFLREDLPIESLNRNQCGSERPLQFRTMQCGRQHRFHALKEA